MDFFHFLAAMIAPRLELIIPVSIFSGKVAVRTGLRYIFGDSVAWRKLVAASSLDVGLIALGLFMTVLRKAYLEKDLQSAHWVGLIFVLTVVICGIIAELMDAAALNRGDNLSRVKPAIAWLWSVSTLAASTAILWQVATFIAR